MVKHAAISSKKFATLLRGLGAGRAPGEPADPAGDPIGTIVFSFLLWESTTDKALAARSRILENIVDFNDLRVCMPEEVASWIGVRYPMALERCQRLRNVLRAIYAREHAMSLDSLAKGGKREAKKYIESLEGMVPFVAARVLLLSFDTHSIPADEQLRSRLRKAEVCEDSVTLDELVNWLTHNIKAGKGAGAHYALQGWVDKDGKGGTRKSSKNGSEKSARKAKA